jgi:hypothetical protein
MSTTLYETDKSKIFRYFGGIDRGALYIITMEGNLKEVLDELKEIKKILEKEKK